MLACRIRSETRPAKRGRNARRGVRGSIQGSHPKLLPDLSAAVDVELERKDKVIVVPRDAIVREKDTFTVRVLDGDSARSRTVTLGAMNDHEVIVASGLEPGATVQRHVAQ